MKGTGVAAVAFLVMPVVLPWASLATGQPEAEAASGEALFEQNCASCHGAEASGTDIGPSLLQVGAADVDFQLRTGRMPLADPSGQSVRKPPVFDDEQIGALVDYVASLGNGPAIPSVAGYPSADLARGQELFNGNCAPCHGATGNGGAVGGSAFAPSLYQSEPLITAEATIIGPGQMPRFAFTEPDRDAIVRYVRYLQTSGAPGGLDIGGVGPVPEGFVAWVIGMAALVVVCIFVGRHQTKRPEEPE